MAIDRRRFLGIAGAGSLTGARRADGGARARFRGLYAELGIRPVLNFRGTHTGIGASKQWPELHAAMAEAARDYVMLEDLEARIGERLARLTGCPDATVTTGAAGGIMLGTAACVTGEDAERVRILPEIRGGRDEVLIQRAHRNVYDHAVRNAGVCIVEVESRADLERAAGSRTAMLYFLGGTSGDWAWETPIPLDECLAAGKRAGFPVLVDAANMLPPWDNIRRLAARGVDLIAISGGKHMRGPQCSGILAGRRDLIRAARLNASPHSDAIGRPMKVGREEMVGLWLAAERYAKLDFALLDRRSQGQAEVLAREIGKIPGLTVSFAPHDRTRRVHRVVARWDARAAGIDPAQCEERLLEGEPRIAVQRDAEGLTFTVFMNDPGDERAAARRMKEIFAAARA